MNSDSWVQCKSSFNKGEAFVSIRVIKIGILCFMVLHKSITLLSAIALWKKFRGTQRTLVAIFVAGPPSWCPFKLIQTIELFHKYWALGGTLPVWWFENSIQSDNVGSVNVCSFSPGIFLVWLWQTNASIDNKQQYGHKLKLGDIVLGVSSTLRQFCARFPCLVW